MSWTEGILNFASIDRYLPWSRFIALYLIHTMYSLKVIPSWSLCLLVDCGALSLPKQYLPKYSSSPTIFKTEAALASLEFMFLPFLIPILTGGGRLLWSCLCCCSTGDNDKTRLQAVPDQPTAEAAHFSFNLIYVQTATGNYIISKMIVLKWSTLRRRRRRSQKTRQGEYPTRSRPGICAIVF